MQRIAQRARSPCDRLEQCHRWPRLRLWRCRTAKKVYDCGKLQEPVKREKQAQTIRQFIKESSDAGDSFLLQVSGPFFNTLQLARE